MCLYVIKIWLSLFVYIDKISPSPNPVLLKVKSRVGNGLCLCS